MKIEANENGRSAVAAKNAGLKRYFGTVCHKHEELGGERNARNRGCIGCNREKMRQRRAENPEYHRKATRIAYEKWYRRNHEEILARVRKKRTGIDADTFSALWKAQGGKCPVCRNGLLGRRPHADHCHDGGGARGILCGTCNQTEGLIKRSGMNVEEFGKSLAEYLSNPTIKRL